MTRSAIACSSLSRSSCRPRCSSRTMAVTLICWREKVAQCAGGSGASRNTEIKAAQDTSSRGLGLQVLERVDVLWIVVAFQTAASNKKSSQQAGWHVIPKISPQLTAWNVALFLRPRHSPQLVS